MNKSMNMQIQDNAKFAFHDYILRNTLYRPIPNLFILCYIVHILESGISISIDILHHKLFCKCFEQQKRLKIMMGNWSASQISIFSTHR